MKIGDYIMRLTGLTQYSPIFGRGGQGGQFSMNVLDVPVNGSTLTWGVETKNTEDTAWTPLGALAITSSGIKPQYLTGLKEQLRFTYVIVGGAGPLPSDTFYVDVLAPVWTP